MQTLMFLLVAILSCASYVVTAQLRENNTMQENSHPGQMVLDILTLESVKKFMEETNSSITQCILLSTGLSRGHGPLYMLRVPACQLFPANTNREAWCANEVRFNWPCSRTTFMKLITDNATVPEIQLEILTTIENANEAPVFTFNSHTDISLSNQMPNGRPFLHGQAIDPDGYTNDVFFGMEGGDWKFHIHKVPLNSFRMRMKMYSDSFYLTKEGWLNKTEKPVYHLILKSWDNGIPPMTGSATVTIRVQ